MQHRFYNTPALTRARMAFYMLAFGQPWLTADTSADDYYSPRTIGTIDNSPDLECWAHKDRGHAMAMMKTTRRPRVTLT